MLMNAITADLGEGKISKDSKNPRPPTSTKSLLDHGQREAQLEGSLTDVLIRQTSIDVQFLTDAIYNRIITKVPSICLGIQRKHNPTQE